MSGLSKLAEILPRVRGVLADAREAQQTDSARTNGMVWRDDVRDEVMAEAILVIAESVEEISRSIHP